MLSSVLNGHRAVQVNIEIMRAFVRLRESVSKHKDLVARKASAPMPPRGSLASPLDPASTRRICRQRLFALQDTA
jgi:hypothetical protein